MADPSAADELFRELERRIDDHLGATEPEPLAEAEHLATAEADVTATIGALVALGTDLSDDRGHPILADLASWRDLTLDMKLPQAAQASTELVDQLVQDIADAWRAQVLAPLDRNDPRACFRAIVSAREFDLEALARQRGASPLAEVRPELRNAMLAAIESHPPSEDTRDDWATQLLDRADAVLASVDGVDPDQAVARLRLVMRDVSWHTTFVEAHKSWRRKRLRRRIRRLTAELQERDLQHRLELRFGAERVAKFDQIILWLIVLVLGLLAVEVFFLNDLDPETGAALPPPTWLVALDTAACAFFLFEIVVKLVFVRGRWRWFWRHLLVDIVPSIPFALFFHLAVGSGGVAARRADKIRIVRAVRLLRIARFARAFGFLSRGIDRLVRKYGEVLNRNIVLYPTRAERNQMAQRHEGLGVQVHRIQARLNRRWRRLILSAPDETRESIAQLRVQRLATAVSKDTKPLRHTQRPAESGIARDRSAEEALDLLSKVTPEEIEAEMGADFVTRVARAVRLFASPMLRWLPFVRSYVPSVHKKMTDGDVVAAAAQTSASELRRQHQRWLWFADLYGIITPAQFVDRVGRTMIKASFRPAYRLVLFGLFIFIVRTLIGDAAWADKLGDSLTSFIEILGGICIVVLAFGWWLRRIAGQATEFLEKSAQAQFLSLTEAIKGRHLARDAAIMEGRVLGPERIVHGHIEEDVEERFVQGVTDWLIEAQAGDAKEWVFSPMETTVLLYRDGIDGALFVSSDTRTTSQLLGNLAIRNLRKMANRFTKKDRKELMKLDLDRQKSFLRGPYLWFALGCQSIAHGVARLVVDYNRNALPRSQHAASTPDEMEKYQHWVRAEGEPEIPNEQTVYVTTQFTALHFLDDDEQRDATIRLRFGADLLARMQRDRRHLLRRTFGTYPLHKLPREERVLNLYRAYSRWLAHGRALFIPLYAVRAVVLYIVRFVKWLIRCMGEIRRPSFNVDLDAVEGADYYTALRKIHRMRGPVALLATKMRARFDPEYCGVRLPGTETSGLETADVQDDIRFLGGDAELERELETERQRIARDMARLSRILKDSGYDRERVRAAACAYVADMRGLRSLLSAREILDEVFGRAAAGELAPFSWRPRWRRRRQFGRYWKQHGVDDADARRAAWRATSHNVEGAADALRYWNQCGEQAVTEGRAVLADLMRHPERISEQIVTLRAVQTLALIDVLNYRDHVYHVGGYAADGDDAGDVLSLPR